MIIQIHMDASYLSKTKDWSWAAGHYFLGWLPQKNQPIRLKGRNLQIMHIPQIHSLVSSWSRIGSTIFKYQRRKSITTNLGGDVTSPTSHSHPLQQCNSGGHRKRDRQETPPLPDGNEIFLQLWIGEKRKFQCTIPPRPWMPRRLPIKTSQQSTSSKR